MAIRKKVSNKLPEFMKDALVGVLVALSAIIFLIAIAVILPKFIRYQQLKKWKKARELEEADRKQKLEQQQERSQSEDIGFPENSQRLERPHWADHPFCRQVSHYQLNNSDTSNINTKIKEGNYLIFENNMGKFSVCLYRVLLFSTILSASAIAIALHSHFFGNGRKPKDSKGLQMKMPNSRQSWLRRKDRLRFSFYPVEELEEDKSIL
ncbi:hypothetical protein H072_3915 [Dactylellina haptotyla CBS 200.50]|uniref:Uncharacterized protein n=1 Tax=Dactylellina haptotyla (strain CBS 200.50) TaxID=1284197 RepID=S8AGR8_DACHA|nr:hypothetical protein H072_3915 [Dactylellina haptotyla CBS 200.50]